MEYRIIYNDGRPIKLQFEPDFVDSTGTYNAPLGRELIREFGVPEWEWLMNGYLDRYIGEVDPLMVISDAPIQVHSAQDCVTQLMDKAVEQRRIAKVLGSI